MSNSNPWKRHELTLKVHGYLDLGIAVVKQWKTDGMPVGDAEGIELWTEFIQSWNNHMLTANVIKQGETDDSKERR
jgi:hypothetical protein